MRPVALLLCLVALTAPAQAGPTVAQRKQLLIEGASAAAAAMGAAEHYAQFLRPMPEAILDSAAMPDHVLFDAGWSHRKDWGTWSLGRRSVLYLRLPPGKTSASLFLHGRYFGAAEDTAVVVNELLLSEAPLHKLRLELPATLLTSAIVKVELLHRDPVSPHELDAAVADRRRLKFGLTHIALQ